MKGKIEKMNGINSCAFHERQIALHQQINKSVRLLYFA